MNPAKTPLKTIGTNRLLSAPEFQGLARMPREVEWFKNIRNPSTKRAYENAIKDFMLFAGIRHPEEFRLVTRAQVIAWRDALGERTGDRSLIGTSIRHRLPRYRRSFNISATTTPSRTIRSRA